MLTNVSDRLRAPCKNYSLVNKYYKKKLASTNPEVFSQSKINRVGKKARVVNFFLKDENLRPSPGIHEVITKRKKKMRKCYLTDTINNLYIKYCDEIGQQVCRSGFYKLKPFWVVHLKVTKRDSTACKEHENFQFLFEKLMYYWVIHAQNLKLFIDSATCNYKNKNCMYGECGKCHNFKINHNGEDFRTWYNYWVTEKVSRMGAKGMIFNVKITHRKKICCKLSELVQKFNSDLRKIFIHVEKNY